MLMKPTEYAQSETYKEILSQSDVWLSVLQQLRQSKSGERTLGSNKRKDVPVVCWMRHQFLPGRRRRNFMDIAHR